ncbi:MAG: hypothetical protein SD837_21955 [Candidatus Electrothrix scaldis]|nr:MAG: hypothetical protein SD837_21955 [Candidatus Electrothrix sp. GW3-3]
MNRSRLASYAVFLILCFWATSSWAATIGSDTTFDIARTIVIPEDGSGGVAAADAIQFNTGFTYTSFFGWVAFLVRSVMETVR